MAETEKDDGTTEVAEATDEDTGADANGAGGGLRSALGPILSKKVLIPVAATAATAAAGFAAKKGPDVAQRFMSGAKEKAGEGTEGVVSKLGEEGQKRMKDALEDGAGGGIGGAVAKVASKAIGGGGGGGGKKKTRRLPIQRWTDVAVPVERAYELWTKFDEFPRFMHRVVDVQSDDGRVKWQEKIWFSKRQWEGEITDQRENDRIAWKTVSGTTHTGVVSFHRLDDRLTRVMVTLDFQPSGILEKMASGLRFAKRAVQADLARFKAYAEMEETEGLEYSAAGAKPEGESEDQEDQRDEDRAEATGDDAGADASGDADAEASSGDESDDDESDEERERKRQERLARREQRREHATA